MKLDLYLKERGAMVDAAIQTFLPPEDEFPPLIHRSMRYSVFAGGKRLRPILVLASSEAAGGTIEEAMPVACAMEMIHTYSLIHDDLPAMDDDDLRRGVPTNHKVFGEGIAVLSGDALLTHAFTVLARMNIPSSLKVRLIEEISTAAGTMGMVGGQVMDLEYENKSVDAAALKYIHDHKTGALFRASVRAGALVGGASKEQLANLTSYATHFGLAFQIADDILDLEGDSVTLGKNTGSDTRKNKATFPAFYGMEEARRMARENCDRALQALASFPPQAEPLRALVRFAVERKH